MHCLWITLADPDPATNGQLIYSEGLIEALHSAGADLCVVGLSRREKSALPLDAPRLAWRLVEEEPLPRWKRIVHPKPTIALRGVSRPMFRTLRETLSARTWSAIVFDSICAGWALDVVLQYRHTCARPPTIVYLSHNHEKTVARRIADASRGARRIFKEVDFLKVAQLERRLVAASGLVTANTPEDCRTFAGEAAGKPVAFLPPGYGGSRVSERTIDNDVPRRAVIIGSFDWPPKRISLERFLAAGAPMLQRAGVELQIVGAVAADYLAGLRVRYPSVTFVGPVEDVRPYMTTARIALVPDLLGGFKLKGLDYVFNRIPILAMRIALPGMPLEDGRSIGLFDSHAGLVEGVIALIDDFETLNRRQALAFDACVARFDWHRVGEHLFDAIRRAGAGPVAGSSNAAPDALGAAAD
jgi:glycosyltransferase involved in cell wall biosynthesis